MIAKGSSGITRIRQKTLGVGSNGGGMVFDNKEVEGVAELLNTTPTKARTIMALRDKYCSNPHLTTVLNPKINPDARIIDVLGWGPGGIGGMVLAGKPRTL